MLKLTKAIIISSLQREIAPFCLEGVTDTLEEHERRWPLKPDMTRGRPHIEFYTTVIQRTKHFLGIPRQCQPRINKPRLLNRRVTPNAYEDWYPAITVLHKSFLNPGWKMKLAHSISGHIWPVAGRTIAAIWFWSPAFEALRAAGEKRTSAVYPQWNTCIHMRKSWRKLNKKVICNIT